MNIVFDIIMEFPSHALIPPSHLHSTTSITQKTIYGTNVGLKTFLLLYEIKKHLQLCFYILYIGQLQISKMRKGKRCASFFVFMLVPTDFE